jgi:ABC-2 type transport system permease protein
MRVLASRASIIRAMVWKDLREFSRDRIWIILTPTTIVFVILAFWLAPNKVNETITVGVFPPGLAQAFESLGEGEEDEVRGIEFETFESEEQLAAAVAGVLDGDDTRDISIGIAFPDNFVPAVLLGERLAVSVYLGGAVPGWITDAISSVIREIVYGMQAAAASRNPAEALPVRMPDQETMILGEDRAGIQVPLREKIRPLMAIMILMVEAIALAGLVAIEIERRTVTALLVTPARVSDVLAAKAITGAALAVSQVLVFLLASRSFGDDWLIVTVLMLIGAVMMSAVGMIAGSAGRDFMSTMFFGIVLITPLIIPAIAALYPGAAAFWVKALPSHGLIEAMIGVLGYSRNWSDVAPHIGTSLAWCVMLFVTALVILKKKVEAL